MKIEKKVKPTDRSLPLRSKYTPILTLGADECITIPKKEYAAVFAFADYHNVKITVRTSEEDKTLYNVWKA